MAKMNVKKGDKVLIIAGKDNGKTGTVLECFASKNAVTVKGVNIVVKHQKPRSAQDKGGIVKYEDKIDVSNVQVVCPVCDKATRVAIGTNEKGQKARICKKCGAVLDSGKKYKKPATKKETVEAPAKEAPAKKEAKASTKTAAVKDTQKHETKATAKTVKTSASKVSTKTKTANTTRKVGK